MPDSPGGSEDSRCRLAALRARMRELEVAAFLLSSPESMRYLSGFRGGEGTALVTSRLARLYVDSRYTEQAAVEAPGWEVVRVGREIRRNALTDVHKGQASRRVAFEADHLVFSRFQRWKKAAPKVEFVPTSRLVEKIRSVKTSDEIAALRKAASIADEALGLTLPLLVPGVTEKRFADELEARMRRLGAEKPAFESIVAFGARSSLPHAIAGETELREGDAALVDFGAVYDGYHSDMTRVFFCGEPSERMKTLFDAVSLAQEAALAAAVPGMTGKELDAVARSALAGTGFEEYFGHGLGHGVGLEIHEEPSISVAGDTPLTEGMVFTVEPGAYLPGLGGVRVEDTVVMGPGGVAPLTGFPKHLWVVPCG